VAFEELKKAEAAAKKAAEEEAAKAAAAKKAAEEEAAKAAAIAAITCHICYEAQVFPVTFDGCQACPSTFCMPCVRTQKKMSQEPATDDLAEFKVQFTCPDCRTPLGDFWKNMEVDLDKQAEVIQRRGLANAGSVACCSVV
jgi:hypothetical protein